MDVKKFISSKNQIGIREIGAVLALINEGATIPFIARYRKEKTGNMDEIQLEDIVKLNTEFEQIIQRQKNHFNGHKGTR